jgi:bacterioferritin-associated ferredoxin
MGLLGQNSSGVTDADIRNMIREHRSEIHELRQEYAIKM